MMIEYRDQNHKVSKFSDDWKVVAKNYRISNTDWMFYEFRINGVIYSSPTSEYDLMMEKQIMWSKLNDD